MLLTLELTDLLGLFRLASDYTLNCYVNNLVLLLRPGAGAEYCDQLVSVCLSVREHISGTVGPIFTIFCADPLWPWLGPPLAALRHVIYFRLYG